MRFLLLLCLLLLPQVSVAQTAAQTGAEIQKRYDESNAAAQRKDLEGCMAIYAPTAVTIMNGSVTDLSTRRANLRGLLESARRIHASSRIISVDANSPQVKVVVQERLEAELVDPKTGTPHQMVATDTSEDTWTLTDRGWLQVKANVLNSTLTLDGKPR